MQHKIISWDTRGRTSLIDNFVMNSQIHPKHVSASNIGPDHGLELANLDLEIKIGRTRNHKKYLTTKVQKTKELIKYGGIKLTKYLQNVFYNIITTKKIPIE